MIYIGLGSGINRVIAAKCTVTTELESTKNGDIMDNIDISILKVLQENGRISVSDISKRIDLSISAVAERLRKLEKAKVIEQYTVVINPTVMDKELIAFMLISLQNPQVGPRFLDFVEQEVEIPNCYYVAGDYDYIVKIMTKNTATLAQVLDRIKSIKGVVKTNTMVILDAKKDHPTFQL